MVQVLDKGMCQPQLCCINGNHQMKITVCDFCGDPVKEPLKFKGPENETCRIMVEKVEVHPGKRGVRWKALDICYKCVDKYHTIARKNKGL